MRKGLYGFTTILILSASSIVLSYFISLTGSSFAANSTSNLLSSLIRPAKKVTSAIDVTRPSINATRLQQIPNSIAANVEKIKSMINTTANDVRSSIKKTISDTRNALLDLGIKLAEIASIIAAAIVVFSLIRRPRLGLDKMHSQLGKRVELAAYDIDDTRIPFNLRTFKISYKINTVLVRNKGWKTAKNCKGMLNIGDDGVKVYWSAFDERECMTINPHSTEYLDLFAIIDGEPSEIFKSLSENISKLKSYINNETFTDTPVRQDLNARIEVLSNRYKSAEEIPRIIIQDANEGWRIPGEQYSFPINEPDAWQSIIGDGNIPIERIKESTKVTVTSENARKLQEPITILDRPFDVRGTAIRF